MNTEERKRLIVKRFEPIINSILLDIKYNDKEKFKSFLIYLNTNSDEMHNHIGSIMMDEGNINGYFAIKNDIEENIIEYKNLLINVIEQCIKQNYVEFLNIWNNKDKYIVLL